MFLTGCKHQRAWLCLNFEECKSWDRYNIEWSFKRCTIFGWTNQPTWGIHFSMHNLHLSTGYNPTHYFLFESERLNYPIRPVFFNDYKRVSLSPSLKNCRVDVGSSRYIGCKGSEVSFNNTDLFSILPDGDPKDNPPYFLKVRLDFRVINWKR